MLGCGRYLRVGSVPRRTAAGRTEGRRRRAGGAAASRACAPAAPTAAAARTPDGMCSVCKLTILLLLWYRPDRKAIDPSPGITCLSATFTNVEDVVDAPLLSSSVLRPF